jgi:primosomal protein N' (replication factor Y)
MYFYEIAPASRQYHGSTPLTYSCDQDLQAGRIVTVKIRNRPALGFVVRQVEKPDFKTVAINDVTPVSITPQQVLLFEWLMDYYPAPLGLTTGLFLPFSALKDYTVPPKAKAEKAKPKQLDLPPLTAEQVSAVEAAQNPANPTVLLHGDTGSGKTRVYIELAIETLAAGRSVLILVPEIALSPQIVRSFMEAMPEPVHVTHSGLTATQRRRVWQTLEQSTTPQVVIGPRSALFTPLKNIGLIVIDEFHEPAYKQDQAPYYQTLRAVSQYARLHKATLVMGSATPPVSEYYIAEQKNVPIIRMLQKATGAVDPRSLKTEIVNLKDEGQRTRYPLISHTLLEAVSLALTRKEQTLLFLNKRGSARLILCQSCGWHADCERCDLPLTFHADSHRLQCHTCGFSRPAPSVCPECSSHDIIFKSPGTKAIVEAIEQAFPDARVARFDKDNLKADRLESRHSEVVSGEIDILIGTQMLAKGHDLPRLSLVGILLAENELQFPDYTSSERSYQLMHQLIGRVGRGHRDGEVIVQTYDPTNTAVQTAVRKYTWQEFYKAQINERDMFQFPPFYYLMKIEITRTRLTSVETACDATIDFLRHSGEPIKIVGPAPSFLEKRNNTYNWQIVVKAKQRTALTRLANTIPIKCTINLDPSNLL